MRFLSWFRLRLFVAFIDSGFRNAEESLHGARKLFERGLAFNWFGLHGSILTPIRDRHAAHHRPKGRLDRAFRLLQSYRPAFYRRGRFLAIRARRCSRSHRHGSWCLDLAPPLVVRVLPQRLLAVVFYSVRRLGSSAHSIYREAAVS